MPDITQLQERGKAGPSSARGPSWVCKAPLSQEPSRSRGGQAEGCGSCSSDLRPGFSLGQKALHLGQQPNPSSCPRRLSAWVTICSITFLNPQQLQQAVETDKEPRVWARGGSGFVLLCFVVCLPPVPSLLPRVTRGLGTRAQGHRRCHWGRGVAGERPQETPTLVG